MMLAGRSWRICSAFPGRGHRHQLICKPQPKPLTGRPLAAFRLEFIMRKTAATSRPFIVSRPLPKKPKSPETSGNPSPQDFVQTQFDFDSLLDDEGVEHA
jgi:hypothetical protein